MRLDWQQLVRYIPVPTGNSCAAVSRFLNLAVYPCTYRELQTAPQSHYLACGISLYLQGTRSRWRLENHHRRYIPVPTGNSCACIHAGRTGTVYPCTYRELFSNLARSSRNHGISLYLQGTRDGQERFALDARYIPVPTGNSCCRFWA